MKGEDLQHRYVDKTNLSYAPNSSVTDKSVSFTAGSNIMTSTKDHLERRYGFPPWLSTTTFTFSGSISRFFTWRRWTGASITLSGAYFVMYNVLTTSNSIVYKQQVGTDALPSQIHIDTTSTNPFDFCVSNDYLFFGNAVDMKKYDGSTVTNWGITAPSTAVTVTTTTGVLSPIIGYQYQIAWENSGSTHISSPSPASLGTGAQSLKNFILTGNTTTDAQVDKVRVFRTIDGGSIYFEHPSSPVAYATWVASGLTDSATDPSPTSAAATSLTTAVAPLPNQNNRPIASQGSVWFANRIWTFVNDTIYYSDFEELVRGVEEESFSSTNSRFVGREITGFAVAGTFLLIFCADIIFRIYGDSLATFRFDTLASGKGCLNRAAMIAFRGMVAWLDASSCVFVTDGQTISEVDISDPIRTDILNVNPATAAMAFHSTGNMHWLMLLASVEYYQTVVLSFKPSLYLRFGEASGTIAYDISGNGLNGTYVGGPTLGTAGALALDNNTAVTFNGVTYATVADNNLLDPGDVFTLAFWINPTNLAATRYLVSKGTNGYSVTLETSGQIILVKDAVGAIVGSTTNITAGSWWHVAITKTGATVHIYINAVDVTGAVTNLTITATAIDLNIGRNFAGTNVLAGSMDEFTLFPTALTAANILAIYTAGTLTTRSLTSGPNLFVFDLDTSRWMPPWPIAGLTALYSGQSAPAAYKLFAGRNQKPLAQSTTTYLDDSSTYDAFMVTNLFDIVPDDNPSNYGMLDHVELETGAIVPTTVKYLTDEDPVNATFTATSTSGNTPPNRRQGVNLVETWYPTYSDPNCRGARRVALRIDWTAPASDAANANVAFKIYGFALAFKVIT